MPNIKYVLFLFTSILLSNLFAQQSPNDLVFTIKTDNPGWSNDSAYMLNAGPPLAGMNYDLDWDGDGIFDTLGLQNSFLIQYDSVGTYTIRVRGVFEILGLGSNVHPENESAKLISFDQWGNQKWHSVEYAFHGCYNFQYNAQDVPDLRYVPSMSWMFAFTNFNTNINNWNVSNVKWFDGLFQGASAFNQPLNNWNTSKARRFYSMFDGASSFNQSLNNWDVSSVEDMDLMFYGASSFNQSLDNWDVSSVEDMGLMFYGASSFNQSLNNWDVSNVIRANSMFSGATNFDQNLGSWDIDTVLTMQGIFSGSDLSIANYDSTIIAWQAKPHQHNVKLGASGLEYCLSDSARNLLIADGWIFHGDSKNCLLTGIKKIKESENRFEIYPNPTSGIINITVNEETNKPILIYNNLGQNILQFNSNIQSIELDLSELENGVYFLRYGNSSKRFVVSK